MPSRGLAAAVVLSLAAFCSLSCAREPAQPPRAPQRATVPLVDAARCGDRMRLVVADEREFCIDTYEWPGFEERPEQASFEDAERICSRRGARLCSEWEWERACRGAEGGLYPYGDVYVAAACATELDQPGVAGMNNACRSSFGVYDLSGNVAEWVQGGLLKGGDATSDVFSGRCGARRTEREPDAPPFRGVRCCKALATM